MKLVAVEDAELSCEHTPRPGAPALLLLHALGANLHMWDRQAEELQQRFELVRYDMRGHGQSTAGSNVELSQDRLARDALAVLDSCGVARAHLCGLSLGGMIAMHIARHWPDRVLKVALCSTSPHMPTREMWNERIATVRSQGMSALTEGILQRWFTPEFRESEPGQVDEIRQMLLAAKPEGYAACCAAIRDMDLRNDLAAINATTLVVGTTRDPSLPASLAESISGAIAGSKLVLLEAAHLANIERAQEFNRTIMEFFGAEASEQIAG
jgi:3-oxoadipate enol-lactonase